MGDGLTRFSISSCSRSWMGRFAVAVRSFPGSPDSSGTSALGAWGASLRIPEKTSWMLFSSCSFRLAVLPINSREVTEKSSTAVPSGFFGSFGSSTSLVMAAPASSIFCSTSRASRTSAAAFAADPAAAAEAAAAAWGAEDAGASSALGGRDPRSFCSDSSLSLSTSFW